VRLDLGEERLHAEVLGLEQHASAEPLTCCGSRRTPLRMYDRISSNASASESMKRGSSAHSSHCSSSELKYLDAASSD